MSQLSQYLQPLLQSRDLNADAQTLGVTKDTLEKLMTGATPLKADVAVGLAKLLAVSPRKLLNLQTEDDLAALGVAEGLSTSSPAPDESKKKTTTGTVDPQPARGCLSAPVPRQSHSAIL